MKKEKKTPRHIKAKENRERILHSAAEIIGELGYLNATVSRITERAGLAQGTFYIYFESQQDLFDQILPHKGKDAMRFIAQRVRSCKDPFEMERQGVLAFQEYLRLNPWFFRVLNEARVVSPKAHAVHMNNLVNGFARALLRWKQQGFLQRYDDSELRTLSKILIGVRDYLFISMDGEFDDYFEIMKESDLDVYMKIVRNGL